MSGYMAAASLALAAIGTATSVAGQANAAAGQAGMANYQAQVARNNQMVAEWNAQRALQQGQVAEQQQRTKSAQLLGAQRAALAAQGGDVNSGSPLDVQGDTARAGEFDAQTIRNNAALQAYGYKVQGAGYGASAAAHSQSAADAMANLPFGLGSSLLSGASSITGKASDWMKGNQGGGGVTANYSAGNAAAGFGSYVPSNVQGWS